MGPVGEFFDYFLRNQPLQRLGKHGTQFFASRAGAIVDVSHGGFRVSIASSSSELSSCKHGPVATWQSPKKTSGG